MEMIGKVRRMYLRDKLSLHEIARRTGLSRNTIRKWLRAAEAATPPRYGRIKKLGKLSVFQLHWNRPSRQTHIVPGITGGRPRICLRKSKRMAIQGDTAK